MLHNYWLWARICRNALAIARRAQDLVPPFSLFVASAISASGAPIWLAAAGAAASWVAADSSSTAAVRLLEGPQRGDPTSAAQLPWSRWTRSALMKFIRQETLAIMRHIVNSKHLCLLISAILISANYKQWVKFLCLKLLPTLICVIVYGEIRVTGIR
jgi:hypothetical protein